MLCQGGVGEAIKGDEVPHFGSALVFICLSPSRLDLHLKNCYCKSISAMWLTAHMLQRDRNKLSELSKGRGVFLSNTDSMTGYTIKLRSLFSKYSIFRSSLYPLVISSVQLTAVVLNQCAEVLVRQGFIMSLCNHLAKFFSESFSVYKFYL